MTIDKVMTRQPHTVQRDQPLAVAHHLMRRYGVRHLPVRHEGALVGVISQRDLYLIESLTETDPSEVPVGEAMTTEVEIVEAQTPLHEVVARMAAMKIGSAIVIDGGELVGIFTGTDGMRLLAELLEAPRAR